MSVNVSPPFLLCFAVGIWWICFPRSFIQLQPHFDNLPRPRPAFIRAAGVVLLLLPFAFAYL